MQQQMMQYEILIGELQKRDAEMTARLNFAEEIAELGLPANDKHVREALTVRGLSGDRDLIIWLLRENVKPPDLTSCFVFLVERGN